MKRSASTITSALFKIGTDKNKTHHINLLRHKTPIPTPVIPLTGKENAL